MLVPVSSSLITWMIVREVNVILSLTYMCCSVSVLLDVCPRMSCGFLKMDFNVQYIMPFVTLYACVFDDPIVRYTAVILERQ